MPECSLGWPALECQGAGRKPSRHVTASSWEGFFVFGFRGASLSIFCADFFFIVLQVRSVKKVVPLAKGGKNGFGEEGTFRCRNVPLVSPLARLHSGADLKWELRYVWRDELIVFGTFGATMTSGA